MAATKTQERFWQYCNQNDFMPAEVVEEFAAALKSEGKEFTFTYGMEKFEPGPCPQCGAAGAFKWHFLGRLRHPGCAHTWFVSPLTYIGRSLSACVRMGMEMGGDMANDAERKGKNGCLDAMFGLVFGFILRLPFALALIPVQLLVYLVHHATQGASTARQPEEE